MEASYLDGMEAEAFERLPIITTIPQTPVQSYIQETLAAILDEVSFREGQLSITLKRRGKKYASLFINPRTLALETSEIQTYTTYRWPGGDMNEALKFSTICCHHSDTVLMWSQLPLFESLRPSQRQFRRGWWSLRGKQHGPPVYSNTFEH